MCAGTHGCGFRAFFTDGQRHNRQDSEAPITLESSCSAGEKRHVNTPRNSEQALLGGTGVWSGEMCLGAEDAVWVQCPSTSLQLPVAQPPLALLCSCCGFPVCWRVFGGYVLQPPESKPSFTLSPSWPMFSAPSSLCPLHPRPATHPPSGLLQGLFAFLLLPLFSHRLGHSLHAVFQPPRQLCSLPSKPALAF